MIKQDAEKIKNNFEEIGINLADPELVKISILLYLRGTLTIFDPAKEFEPIAAELKSRGVEDSKILQAMAELRKGNLIVRNFRSGGEDLYRLSLKGNALVEGLYRTIEI